MNGPARMAIALLWISLAAAGAVFCHLVAGASHGAYADYAHIGLAPLSVLAASLLVTLTFAAWADRASCSIGRKVWFVRGAMNALATPSRRHVRNVLFLQLGTTFVMEEIEHVVATGHPCVGTTWLGMSPLVAIALQVLVAVLTVVVLRSFLGAVVDSCDRLLRLALVILRAVLVRGRALPADACGAPAERALSRGRLVIARHCALRAPPTHLRNAI